MLLHHSLRIVTCTRGMLYLPSSSPLMMCVVSGALLILEKQEDGSHETQRVFAPGEWRDAERVS